MCRHVSFAVLLVAGALTRLQGAEEPPQMDWRQAATKAGLTDKEQERLAKDKLLVSRSEVKQSFSAYLGGEIPSFVTSDSVLNAYHVLFEETLRQQELVNAGALRRFLPELWKLLAVVDQSYAGDAKLIQAAQQRARFVVGVSVKLLGMNTTDAPEELKRAIETEAAAIEKANGQRKAELLGPPEPDFIALDYTLFRPAGFYAETSALQCYFRAVRWLQLVPFRMKNREELLAWHMTDVAMEHAGSGLKDAERKIEEKRIAIIEEEFRATAGSWKAFGMDETPGALVECASSTGYYPGRRRVDEAFFQEMLTSPDFPHALRMPHELANDRVRQPPGPDEGVEIRLLPSLRLPEDSALRRCADVHPEAGRPAGLEFAAWLDFPPAKDLLQGSPTRDRMRILEAARPGNTSEEERLSANSNLIMQRGWQLIDENSGVCWAQMHALRGLWEPDKRAPDFMRNEAWRRKTLLTVTASWAQYRHAWVLQAKPDILFKGVTNAPTTLLEPVPVFFQRLAAVCTEMASISEEAELRSDPFDELENELAAFVETFSAAPSEEGIEVADAYTRLESLARVFDFVLPDPRVDGKWDWNRLIPAIEAQRKLLTAGDPGLMKRVARYGKYVFSETSRSWRSFSSTCLQLALAAQKQLDQIPFSKSEAVWLEGLGSTFAGYMLYRGNSYIAPRDDAPRIARISSDPSDGSVMHAGIGRPRLMYVLYPWQGKEVLCRGVVMPYHEVTEKTTLTDAEWRERFQGQTRPAMPEWLKDFVPTDGVSLVKRKPD